MYIDLVEIGNFRKLLGVRINLSREKTVFVGANNSGKTSAMVALRYFLIERERKNISFNDFTLAHWPTIDAIGRAWSEAEPGSEPDQEWVQVCPFIDVWLNVERGEAHYVQKIIPTLDWAGGRLGVRLRFEPRDAAQLKREYITARQEALKIEQADKMLRDSKHLKGEPLLIWPKTLTDFLHRRLLKHFIVKAYILDPDKLVEPKNGIAQPQSLVNFAVPIDGDPFKGLIRIDEISAQRGFGHEGVRESEESDIAAGATAMRKLSDQLRRYWNKHLDPFDSPDAQDLNALRAIEEAQRAFDDRLKAGFKPAFDEVEGIGYPGVADPRLKVSTRLRPVDGLNHESAVQYMIRVSDGKEAIDLALPEDTNGLGYQNLISMIFRLMGFRDAWMRVGKVSTRAPTADELLVPPLHLVLLEEPEAYLHTQVQQVFIRRAYDILRKHPALEKTDSFLSTQMVVSTHSSHVAHECEFDTLRYFRRLPAGSNGVPTTGVIGLGQVFGTDEETRRFVTRYLKVTHSDLFFADAAVLLEGPAERLLVPFFVRHRPDLALLRESYVTWLEIGGSHAHRLRPLIEHLGLTTLIISDLDAKDKNGKAVPPARNSSLQSRNATLKSWCPLESDLDKLLDLPSEKKIRTYATEGFAIRVAYQCPVTVEFKKKNVEALANTLEDALILQNIPFFSKSVGKGLFARFKISIDKSATIADLSSSLFNDLKDGEKAEFALDLLEVEKPTEMEPPFYIKDGLLWLVDQLQSQQKELGVAPATLPKSANPLVLA